MKTNSTDLQSAAITTRPSQDAYLKLQISVYKVKKKVTIYIYISRNKKTGINNTIWINKSGGATNKKRKNKAA
jgi:hypothetical protein